MSNVPVRSLEFWADRILPYLFEQWAECVAARIARRKRLAVVFVTLSDLGSWNSDSMARLARVALAYHRRGATTLIWRELRLWIETEIWPRKRAIAALQARMIARVARTLVWPAWARGYLGMRHAKYAREERADDYYCARMAKLGVKALRRHAQLARRRKRRAREGARKADVRARRRAIARMHEARVRSDVPHKDPVS